MTITMHEHLQRRLRHYRDESADSDLAALLNRFEVFLGGFLELYEWIKEFDRSWRDDVFKGVLEYTPQDHDNMNELFRCWLKIAEYVQHVMELYEQQNFEGGVAGLQAFSTSIEDVRKLLANNKTPTISAAVGLRRIKVDSEGSKMIREMLKN